MTSSALARAVKTNEPQKQLKELLVAWRALRHPRVADLIDRLDARLLESAPRITAKSVPARAQALIAAAKTKDPLELGRVLASEWPKEWQAALPVLVAVCEAPDDPRVARKLASIVDLAAHQSRGARGFWATTFARLDALGDARQLPVLEAQLARSKSRYYREHSQAREARAVERHRALEVAALSPADERSLAELEAPFAAKSGVEKTRRRSGGELLEAVWAHPSDSSLRAVYGDWLVEQGDPRGELIALQLGAPSAQAARKIQALIDKHWKKWLGPLADWFKVAPRFELGFPSWGRVGPPSPRDGRERLEPLLGRPEWSTFRHLGFPWDVLPPHELIVGARFKGLTSLGNLEPKYVAALAKVKPALTHLTFSYGNEKDVLAPGTWDAFEHLEHLTTSPLTLGAVLSGFGTRPLETLELALDGAWVEEPFDAWWPRLDRAPIETVVMHCYETTVRVTRAKPGAPFTRVHSLVPQRLERMALVFPPGMAHLTREPGTPIEAPRSAVESFEKQLARYPKLAVRDLPFALESPHVSLHVGGASYADESIPKLWELARDVLGVTFDEVQIGYSGKARPLGAEPQAELQKVARGRRDSWLYLSKQGAQARLGVSREALEARLPLTSGERFFDAILALLAWGGTEVSLGKERYAREAFKLSTLARKKPEVLQLLAALGR